jgi:hypothetical protein
MGRRRRDRNQSPQKNNSIKDSVGNQESRYPVPDPNKTPINNTKEPSNAQKDTLKEGIFFFYFLFFANCSINILKNFYFIHMCIQCLGHFSPFPYPVPFSTTPSFSPPPP